MAYNYNGGYQPYTPQMNNYYPYSPNTQQRLQNLEQQYPQFGQTMQQQQTQTNPNISIGFVTSIEEAKAQPPQLDGSKQFFINTSTGEIYTKQFNIQTGGADFDTYKKVIVQEPTETHQNEPDDNTNTFTTEEKIFALNDKILELERRLDYVQSNGISSNDVTTEPASTTDDTANAGTTTTRSKSKSNNKPASTAKSKQSNATTDAG